MHNKLYRFNVYNIYAHVSLCNERNITDCYKFTQLHSYQILFKLINIWQSYCKNQQCT